MVIDGYHWSLTPGKFGEDVAGAYFYVEKQRAIMIGEPEVTETKSSLRVKFRVQGGKTFLVIFSEQNIHISLQHDFEKAFDIRLKCDPKKAPKMSIERDRLTYEIGDFKYKVRVRHGHPQLSPDGWILSSENGFIELSL